LLACLQAELAEAHAADLEAETLQRGMIFSITL
jgi:hypothetical protein